MRFAMNRPVIGLRVLCFGFMCFGFFPSVLAGVGGYSRWGFLLRKKKVQENAKKFGCLIDASFREFGLGWGGEPGFFGAGFGGLVGWVGWLGG